MSDGSSPPPPPRPAAPPTPVRAGVGSRRAVDEAPPARRTFEAGDGAPWTAAIGGRTRVGRSGEVGVPVLLLLFRPADVPEDQPPAREVLAPGEDLESLSDARLVSLLGESKPFRPLPEAKPDERGGRRSPSPRGRSGRRRG